MSNTQGSRPPATRYVACYAAFAVITVISIWLMLQLRVAIMLTGLLLNFNRYAMTVLDQFGFIILGLLWLIAFFAVEAYLRHGVKLNVLWQRVGKVAAWEIGLLILAYAVQALPTWAPGT